MLCVLKHADHYVSGISLDREGCTLSVSDDAEFAMFGARDCMIALQDVFASWFEDLDLILEEIYEV